MRAVILAGGLGTRLSEETSVRPKPLVEVGGLPILWHVMKIYHHHGIDDFVVCAGYKGHQIAEFFATYRFRQGSVSFDFANDTVECRSEPVEPWRVTVVHTGDDAMTGGRLRRVRDLVGDETFCFTYGDGVADVDVGALVDFHRAQGRQATMTVVQPPGRFGAVSLAEDQTDVDSFMEKPQGDGSWVNGGFFVLEPDVIDRIEDDTTV